MVMNTPKPRTNQGAFGGFEHKLVRIAQIIPERHIAQVIDEKSYQVDVPITVLPSPSRLPKAGEYWYIEKVLGQWIFRAYISDSMDAYQNNYEVHVDSIDEDNVATVTTITEPTKTFTVNTMIQRSKGVFPSVGETWIIDNSIADQFTFAAFTGIPEDPEPEPEPFSWTPIPLSSGFSNGGNSTVGGTGTFGYRPEYAIAYNPTRVFLRGIVRRSNNSNFDTPGQPYTIGTLPTVVRPTQNVYFTANVMNTTSQHVNVTRGEIDTLGQIIIRFPPATSPGMTTSWISINDDTFYHLT